MGDCAHEDWRAEQSGDGALLYRCSCGVTVRAPDVEQVDPLGFARQTSQGRAAACRLVLAQVCDSFEAEAILDRVFRRFHEDIARAAGTPSMSPDAEAPGAPKRS